MPLTLYVDEHAWRAHHQRVLADRPGLVPVAKGNGYGFTVDVLAGAAAELGLAAGIDQLAVGTAQEAWHLLDRFPHDLVLLEPFMPGAEWVDLPDRVIRNAASLDAVRFLAGTRIVIDCRSSLRRQGVARSELRQVRRALGRLRPEGYCVHLPIDRPSHADLVREISDWMLALHDADLEVPVLYVSHLARVELDALSTRFPLTRFRPRVGTDLWLGEPRAIEARATVLDVLPVAKGDRIGYRQGRLRHGGWIAVVSGGTVQGVGLEAPKTLRGLRSRVKELARSGMRAMNRTLSPFSWEGRRAWFAEPPHMSVSMIYLPANREPPRPGSELVAELRHTATHFDRVAMVGARQGTAGAYPLTYSSS